MILEEYLKHLQSIVENNPNCSKLEVRYDINNKGEICELVKYPPSVGVILAEDGILKKCVFVN